MTFQAFLIKYGEIGIKGKNRYLFEDALMRQIRFALQDVEGSFHVHRSQGRIYVECDGYYDYEETVEALKRVFEDIPIIYNADIGHVSPQLAIVNGAIVKITSKDGKGKVETYLK